MQHVVIYRSPAEAAMWDIMSNSPNAFPIIVAIVAFIATFGILEHYMPTRRNNPKWQSTEVKLILSAIVCIAVGHWLWV